MFLALPMSPASLSCPQDIFEEHKYLISLNIRDQEGNEPTATEQSRPCWELQGDAHCIRHFSHCCDQMPDQDNLREEEFSFTHSLEGYSPSWWLRWQQEREASWLCYTHNQEAEREEFLCPVRFLLYCSARMPPHGIVLPMFRLFLPSSVNLLQEIPHRHAQRLVSWVSSEPVQLITIAINHHTRLNTSNKTCLALGKWGSNPTR